MGATSSTMFISTGLLQEIQAIHSNLKTKIRFLVQLQYEVLILKQEF